MQSNADTVVLGAVNTLRTWMIRREVKGKPVSREDARSEAVTRWPQLTATQVDEIVRKVIA